MKELINQTDSLPLTDEVKENADGEFISLPSGETHYELKGDGELCVLVHGYATPYYLYDKQFSFLLSKGYKVLRYDLLGRGLSERVEADYTPELFAAQLDELTTALFGNEKFNLFGTSMGGAIIATFSALHPEKVKRAIFLAPAGMDTFKPPFYMTMCKIKGFGDFIFNKVAKGSLVKKCASELHYSKDEYDYYVESFAACSKYEGFLRCTLSSLRNTILATEKVTQYYKKMAKTDIPALCIWGTIDQTMPYYQAERFKEVMPKAKLVTFENSGHIFLFDEGEKTNNEIELFLNENAQ